MSVQTITGARALELETLERLAALPIARSEFNPWWPAVTASSHPAELPTARRAAQALERALGALVERGEARAYGHGIRGSWRVTPDGLEAIAAARGETFAVSDAAGGARRPDGEFAGQLGLELPGVPAPDSPADDRWRTW